MKERAIRRALISISPTEIIDLIRKKNRKWPVDALMSYPCSAGDLDAALAAVMTGALHGRTSALKKLIDIANVNEQWETGDMIALAALGSLIGKRPRQKPRERRGMIPKSAKRALVDLRDAFAGAEQDFFLISGTLLGIMREGRLLAHDTDIDVGILNGNALEYLRHALCRSSSFRLIPHFRGPRIKLAHKSGIKVDVFLHVRDGDKFWHGTETLRWSNSQWWQGNQSMFQAIDYAGCSFLVPTDWDLYLTENYGDWRTPNKNFNATLEAPNLTTDEKHHRLHFKSSLVGQIDSTRPTISKYLTLYRNTFGEDDFIRIATAIADQIDNTLRPSASADPIREPRLAT
jgi:hypothetical protein